MCPWWFASCPFKQIQILIIMETDCIAKRKRCQRWRAFTSKSCMFCSNLVYVTVSEDGNIKSSVVAPKFSLATAFCGNRQLPGNQTVTISTFFSCLLQTRRGRSARSAERAGRLSPGEILMGLQGPCRSNYVEQPLSLTGPRAPEGEHRSSRQAKPLAYFWQNARHARTQTTASAPSLPPATH